MLYVTYSLCKLRSICDRSLCKAKQQFDLLQRNVPDGIRLTIDKSTLLPCAPVVPALCSPAPPSSLSPNSAASFRYPSTKVQNSLLAPLCCPNRIKGKEETSRKASIMNHHYRHAGNVKCISIHADLKKRREF